MKSYSILIIISALLLVGCASYNAASLQMTSTQNGVADDYERYVQTYYPLAVEQMKKYGIPASITLAQGLLESGAGKSELARKSNNHFGIKADKSWNGRSMSSMDNGRMCKFRKYDKVGESYEDHSKFLVGRQRYAALFKLKPTDYEGWAKGLKQAGYAEDSKYPQKLISLIERYNLQRFDSKSSVGSGRLVKTNNGIPYVVVEAGDRMVLLADELGISARKLRRYNDIYDKQEPVPGDVLYIKKKKSKAAKGTNFHTTAHGESLYIISQHYGVRLKDLYRLNPQYKSYTKLKVGDVLRLR